MKKVEDEKEYYKFHEQQNSLNKREKIGVLRRAVWGLCSNTNILRPNMDVCMGESVALYVLYVCVHFIWVSSLNMAIKMMH